MKIVVIGGTGLIGSKLVEKLRKGGHEPLAEALEGAQVVVDVSNSTDPQKLLAAEAAAGVGHHVMLSVVGGYSHAQLADEEAVKAGPVPYTIVRATQFFELIGEIADSSTGGDTVRVPPVLVQPVAADDVAGTLADVAVGSPLNDTVELAGPEAFPLDELVQRVLHASDDPRRVTADVHARYFGAELDERSLIPGDDARIASTRFEDWLSQSTTHQTRKDLPCSPPSFSSTAPSPSPRAGTP
jgi:uncharacterized protein YbjT (DUF2867 family)